MKNKFIYTQSVLMLDKHDKSLVDAQTVYEVIYPGLLQLLVQAHVEHLLSLPKQLVQIRYPPFILVINAG